MTDPKERPGGAQPPPSPLSLIKVRPDGPKKILFETAPSPTYLNACLSLDNRAALYLKVWIRHCLAYYKWYDLSELTLTYISFQFQRRSRHRCSYAIIGRSPVNHDKRGTKRVKNGDKRMPGNDWAESEDTSQDEKTRQLGLRGIIILPGYLCLLQG